MTQADFDARVTAMRGDLAAANLRGHVEAKRFAEGETYTVLIENTDVKRRPRPDAPLETQLLYGERITVYDEEDGWGWAQAERDRYVGYVAMSALGRAAPPATHRIVANRTFVYPAPDMKQPHFAAVPLDGRVAVERQRGDFFQIYGHGFIFAGHARPLDMPVPDFVETAERLIGTPYLWGGKSPLGIDCSGLVQLATSVAGIAMPRDTDMQEKIGESLAFDERLEQLRRGDLVFWRGHVGIMTDASTLLHANAFHMLVSSEPLHLARDRIAAGGSPITSIRRIVRESLSNRPL